MRVQFNIAIDGHSSCGKSTIAKYIAKKFNMIYIDTGAMYRAITLFCMQNKLINNKIIDIDRLTFLLDSINIDFMYDIEQNKTLTLLNNNNVEDIIRGIKVSENVSVISQIKIVRDKLIALQQKMGMNGNVVMDGRDIGTKVFPDAGIKFFITAKADIRAKRRFKQLILKNDKLTYEEVLLNINKRDQHDVNRKINPLIIAKDAILLDNSDITSDEQNKIVCNIIKDKLQII